MAAVPRMSANSSSRIPLAVGGTAPFAELTPILATGSHQLLTPIHTRSHRPDPKQSRCPDHVPLHRNHLGHVLTKVRVALSMKDSRICIANLSKCIIGADNSNILGSLLVTRIA